MEPLHDAATKQQGVDPVAADPGGLERWLGRRIGNYVVDRPLARGGMGTVYVARHPHLGREVAVKFLADDVSAAPELAARFLSEARVTASLNHPNIVEILDFGEIDGALYYVMELLRGKSLRGVMREHGRLASNTMVLYVQQICWALEAAHAAGIVHRDLKPANVLVLEGDPVRLKLLDFGVAKLMAASGPNPTQTRHGQVLGTATHMAPEQALGDPRLVTPQSDLYSLGAIAYEMLTGKPVFHHESDVMLMVMHLRDAVPPIREQVPDVPAAVAALIEACLAKNPAERPPGARALAERLAAALNGTAATAPAPPAVPKVTDPTPFAERATRIASTAPPPAATQAPTQAAPVPLPREVERATRVDSAPPPAAAPKQPPAVAKAPAAEPPPGATAPEPARNPPALEPARKAAAAEAARANPALALPPPAELTRPSPAVPAARAGAPAVEVRAPAPKPAAATALPTQVSPAAPVAGRAEQRQVADRPTPAGVRGRPRDVVIVEAPAPSAEATIQTLLARLQRRGDFPAFARTVGEVSQKADANGAFSAGQLGESILKDYALTAKLLRIVNANYARRFGGRIYSVQHAIVILGFDRVRSLALTISLFKTSGTGKEPARVSESAISALVSSEIARNLAVGAGVNEDEATVCGMFKNLGRHLVLVYLPELFDQIQTAVADEGLNVTAAAKRVLGISFEELGTVIAKKWQLPEHVVNAIATTEMLDGQLARSEDRLNALAGFSNELCDIVTREEPEVRDRAVTALLRRNKQIVNLDNEALLEVLTRVEDALTERYATLIGADLKSSRFVANVTGASASLPPAGAEAAGNAQRGAPANRPREAPLQLARLVVPAGRAEKPVPGLPPAVLEQRIAALREGLERGQPADTLLGSALKLFAEHTGARPPLILTATADRQALVVRFGLRDDMEGLKRAVKFPLRTTGNRQQLFASAYNSGKDQLLKDCYDKDVTPLLPPSYYEVLGAQALGIYACLGKGVTPALLVVEGELAGALPAPARVAELAELRPLIARAAARA